MQRYTLKHGGHLREYFVFLPSTYDGEKIHPVALFMHGYGGTATGIEAEVTQGLNQYAEEYGYVMVYPQGTWFMASVDGAEPWEVTSWNHMSDKFDTGPEGPICTEDANRSPCPPECGNCGRCGWTSCNDDVGFLRALVDSITTSFRVDADRFFVSGFSNGAMMANRIGCEASELFAAVALIGGRVEPGFECTPTRGLPLLQINGGADEIAPHDGRVSSSGWFYASTTAVTHDGTRADPAPSNSMTGRHRSSRARTCSARLHAVILRILRSIACGRTGTIAGRARRAFAAAMAIVSPNCRLRACLTRRSVLHRKNAPIFGDLDSCSSSSIELH